MLKRRTIAMWTASICSLLALLGLTLLSTPVWVAAQASAPEPSPIDAPRTRAHALLVGVTIYPNNDGLPELEGPANDVVLMRRLLQERYGFPAENVRILAESEGKDRLPTRKNIEAELRRLAEIARPGDQVVVLLCGHGSLQPQSAETRFPQPDGSDRIFLPRDVERWSDEKGSVPNAIRGDEIGAWLRPIAEKKASLWLVLDACHSGQGVRGTEKVREVDPEAKTGLAIPRDAFIAAEKRAVQRNTKSPPKAGEQPDIRPLPSLEGVTILYACQSTETTVEKPLPVGAADRKPYGLLTFTLNQILTQSDAPLSYLELAQRIEGQYANMGRTGPTPLVEGKDRNREVLGLKEHPRRSLIRLVRGEDGLKITAGAVHGLSRGSVLAVYPAAGNQADRPLGYVRITEDPEMATASVEPCSYKDQEPRKDLTEGRCRLIAVDYGDRLKLRVGIDPLDNCGKSVSTANRNRLMQILKKLSESEISLFTFTETGDAEWQVRLDSGKIYLVPQLGWPLERGKTDLPALFGPYADDSGLADTLQECLGRIARVRNLRMLAGDPSAAMADSHAKVKVELRLLKGKRDREGQAIEWPNPSVRFFDKDLVRLIIHNPNPYAVDVTLLDIDPAYKITCLFPSASQGETSRIEGGAVKWVPDPIQIGGKVSGPEHLVVIAVKAQKLEQPVDFASLESEGLEQARDKERTRGIPKSRGLQSPLGQLLQRSQYGVGTRASRKEIEESELVLYSWQFVAKKRP